MIPLGVVTLVFVLAGGLALAVAARTRPRFDEPVARPFAVLAATVGVAACGLGATALLADSMGRWIAAALVVVCFPLPWAGFAFSYTGYSNAVAPRRAGLLALVPAGVCVVVLTEYFVGGMTPGGLFVLSITTGTVYASTLALASAGVLVKSAYDYEHFPPALGWVLSVGGLVPWLALLTGVQAAQFRSAFLLAPAAVGFPVGAAALAVAHERYPLFESSPAAGTIGRDAVLEEVDDAVVVVDHRERVVDLNAAAQRIFELSPETATSQPVESVLGTTLSAVRARESLRLHTRDGRRTFEVTVSTVGEGDDREIGEAVLLHDVTEREQRRQHLSVLNRVLRHNLRNDMTVVTACAEVIADDADGEPAELADRIVDTAADLVEMGDKARTIESVMRDERASDAPTDLSELVDDLVAQARRSHPAATVEADVSEGVWIRANPRILSRVVQQLIENAIEHNDGDPTVRVGVETDPGAHFACAIHVRDDGPGIPDDERSAILRGDETPLEHGSGLGLWLVRWGVERLGGDLSFGDPEEGAEVVVSLHDLADPPAANRTAVGDSVTE